MSLGYRIIARVEKTHGIKGEVVAVPASGLLPVLTPGLSVCVVPPLLKGSRWHDVLSADTLGTGQLISLSGVTSTNQAHELVGKYLLVRSDSVEIAEDTTLDDYEDLIGLEVIDERLGSLGEVTEIQLGAVQDILCVSSDKGETLIPMVEELVWYSDDETHLESALPYGLAPWDTSEESNS